MVTADLTGSCLLKHFIVLTGTTGPDKNGSPTLDTSDHYMKWPRRVGNTATIAFQKKHWFDAVITLRWLKWLLRQYGEDEIIGLIWDHAPGHRDSRVQEFLEANKDRLVTHLIPSGMTSILQVT